MRIQSIDAGQQQTSFQAMKLPKLKIKPRVGKQLTYEKEQERNSMQAIMFALAFIAAAFTKYFIDTTSKWNKKAEPIEIISQTNNITRQDTIQWK